MKIFRWIVVKTRCLHLLLSIVYSGIWSCSKASCDWMLRSLGVTHGQKKGTEHLIQFYKQPHGILVFNHPTCFDHLVILQATLSHQISCRFLVKEAYVRFPLFRKLCEKLNCLFVGKDTTLQLKAAVDKRLKDEPLLAVAPSGGYSCPEPDQLCAFRRGAFFASDRVLPVVLRYHPFHRWQDDYTMLQYLWDRLSGQDIEYVIEFLPEIIRQSEESVEEFAERTKLAMEKALQSITFIPTRLPVTSALLVQSSFLFLISSIQTFWYGDWTASIGMSIVWMTSVLYHSFPSTSHKWTDMFWNLLLGILFGIRSLIRGQFTVIGWCLVAGLGYLFSRRSTSAFPHLLLVHLPVFIGFRALTAGS